MARVAVIGGGISGLACVHRLPELKEEGNFQDSVIQCRAGHLDTELIFRKATS